MKVKGIPGYPDYKINEYGDIFSIKYGYWQKLKPRNNGNGYFYVSLYAEGKSKNKFVHRLVLLTFDRAPKDGEEARHFPDRDRTNNHISNLQWGTSKENSEDTWLVHKTGSISNKSRNEDHYKCKLTNQHVLEIRKLYKGGNYTQKVLAEKYGVSGTHIGLIVNNKTRKL